MRRQRQQKCKLVNPSPYSLVAFANQIVRLQNPALGGRTQFPRTQGTRQAPVDHGVPFVGHERFPMRIEETLADCATAYLASREVLSKSRPAVLLATDLALDRCRWPRWPVT